MKTGFSFAVIAMVFSLVLCILFANVSFKMMEVPKMVPVACAAMTVLFYLLFWAVPTGQCKNAVDDLNDSSPRYNLNLSISAILAIVAWICNLCALGPAAM